MPAADHVALIQRRGKAHTYTIVTPGTISASTNAVTGGSTSSVTAYGVYQKQHQMAVSGVAVALGDEVLLLEAGPLGGTAPKANDKVTDGSFVRVVVAFEPVRDVVSAIYAWRLLLRGPVDAG